MQRIALLKDLESPSYILACSGVREHAYVVSLDNKQFWKRSWFHANAEEDIEKINVVNEQLPDCPELTTCFTGKYNKKLSEYYLGTKIIGFEDQVILDIPDAIFLQRVSSRTKTFDMIMFYGTNTVTFSVVDKSDLDNIRSWYPHKIYSCGSDPLPLTKMKKWMDENKSKTMYDDIYENLFNEEESSCSEYEPESEPESEEESCAESEEDSAPEESEEEYDRSDGEYQPEEELEEERPTKRIKV